MKRLTFTKSHADPALFFKWHPIKGLMVWLSWTDDLICFGPKSDVQQEVSNIKEHFDVDDVGMLTDYLGCTINIHPDPDPNRPDGLTLTQSVLIQTLIDTFHTTGTKSTTPAFSGATLHPPDEGEESSAEDMAAYHTIVGKLMHLLNWPRPDIANAVREASRRVKSSTAKHRKYVDKIVAYVVNTPKRG